jgi:hypothetical protein
MRQNKINGLYLIGPKTIGRERERPVGLRKYLSFIVSPGLPPSESKIQEVSNGASTTLADLFE